MISGFGAAFLLISKLATELVAVACRCLGYQPLYEVYQLSLTRNYLCNVR
jgi:hypothetical protein